MLIRRATLDAIRKGEVSLAFRRWRRPTVKAGGTLATAIGVLAIDEATAIDAAAITETEAAQAGYASADALRRELDARPEGQPYRIRLRYAGEDPRLRLREQFDEAVLRELRDSLARLDPEARWAWPCLDLIATQAGRPAAELARVLGLEKSRLKLDIRKLKALGLTESLEVGYRLSPRGRALVQRKT